MNDATVKADLLAVINAQPPKAGNVTIIAIDGHGGSGKSTLASWLAEKLNAQIIHTDDFASWDNPTDWWPILIDRVFEPIKHGAKTLSYPRSKWWDDHSPKNVVDQRVTDIMILEGVSASRREFQEYVSVNIFVDTPRRVCLRRGIRRDTITGKPKLELEKIWNTWLDNEEIYMQRDRPKEHADIVVDGTKPFERQVML